MWKVTYKKVFLQELKRLPQDIRPQIEELVFTTLPAAENPLSLPRIKKLIGYREYYRARFGPYRVGLHIDQQAQLVECCRVRHRKDIYRFFP